MEYIVDLYVKLASGLTAVAIILFAGLGGPPSSPGAYLVGLRKAFTRKVAAPVVLRIGNPQAKPTPLPIESSLQERAGGGCAREWGYDAKALVKAQGIGE